MYIIIDVWSVNGKQFGCNLLSQSLSQDHPTEVL